MLRSIQTKTLNYWFAIHIPVYANAYRFIYLNTPTSKQATNYVRTTAGEHICWRERDRENLFYSVSIEKRKWIWVKLHV